MSRSTTAPAPKRPGLRGWPGRGGGAMPYLDPAPEFRGTTVQVCGLWPFVAGSGAPATGVPLGRSLTTGATVCADPISWFTRAKLIHNPSAFVLGQPGLGKSTAVRRMVLGLAGYGVQPIVVGDLKPDYVDLVRALHGQVIQLGRGRGSLNVLDPGEAGAVASQLSGRARTELLADIHGRRKNAVSGLVTILRRSPPTAREENILAAALRLLDERHDGVPLLSDLLAVITQAPEQLRAVALDRGQISRYQEITEDLESALTSLLAGGPFGDVFARHTSEPMRFDRPVCFDISSIDDSDDLLQAAALLSCWSYGFSAVNAAHVLADEGLAPRRNFFIVLDELWRVLRTGSGLVNRVDQLTRLNRQEGAGHVMITHSMKDLLALPSEEDRLKAAGFVERSGFVLCAGLPSEEMPRLSQVVAMTSAEQQMVSEWSTPPGWSAQDGGDPPGRGNFLIKVGGRPGIPLHVDLTRAEYAVNDTNKRWRQ